MIRFKSSEGTAKSGFPVLTTMPPQKISSSEKDDIWQKQCVDAIIGKAYSRTFNGRSTSYRKQVNYNLVNSIFDETDIEYLMDPYGVNPNAGSLTKMQDFNIIRPKIERLKGEELKRPFNFMVAGIGGEVISIKNEYKQKMFLESYNQFLQIELQNHGMGEPETDEEGNPVQPKTPQQIENYLNYSYKDTREKYANDVLRFLIKYRKLQSKFNKGWEHGLISSEEIYYTGISGGHPDARVVNPVNFDFDRPPDLEDIQDAQWCKEDRWLPIGQILDEFREYLEDEDIDAMENGTVGVSFPNNSMIPGFGYSDIDTFNSRFFYDFNSNGRVENIKVSTVCWKSMRKIGFLTYLDENGEQEEEIVDDNFKLPKELKNTAKIEWQWINEVWEGTKIGMDIYVNIRPLPNQIKNPNNPSECKLPYIGKVYNSVNSLATSIVDFLKPHQYSFIIIWNRYLMELAKSKGRVMLMDLAQIAKSQGHNVETFMYYLDKGIAFLNSMEEGKNGEKPNYNQITALDLSASSVIETYLNALDRIEAMAGDLVGVTKQRQGDISASENVGNVNTAIAQSSLVTEYWFSKHNEVKEAVLTRLIELSKLCYHNGLTTQFFLDDGYSVFLDVDGELYNDSEYGVFVTNSSKDNQIKEDLKSLAQAALQNDKIRFSDIIKILKSDSISEIEHTIKDGEQQQINSIQQQQEADRQNSLTVEDKRSQAAKEQREWEAEQRQLDRENKIEVATINTLKGKDGPSDADNNGVIDSLEQSKVFLDQSKLAYNSTLKEKELALKDKEIQIKAATEKYKADKSLEIAKENKTSAELKRKQSQKSKKKK